MNRRRGNAPSSSVDWLPWGLSVFGAVCAVFVLIRGVLPERSANRELVQQVTRLETDLSRIKQDTEAELARARDQLAQQALSTQAEVNAAREQERLRAAKDAARRDFGQSLAAQIDAGDVALDDRAGELVVVVRDKLLFAGSSSLIEPKGRRFLRELAGSIHRLPAEQIYRISGKSEKQQRAIARYLEFAGRVPHAQLATAGAPTAGGPSTQPGNVEIVLVLRRR
jgi:flagellar motor protein MotB